jgi:hypothetical protein
MEYNETLSVLRTAQQGKTGPGHKTKNKQPQLLANRPLNKLKPWNHLLGLSFHCAEDILAPTKQTGTTWHCAALNGHSSLGKPFPLSETEGQLKAQKGVYTVSQSMETDDLTGRLTMDENRALLADLALSPFFSTNSGFSFVHSRETQPQRR